MCCSIIANSLIVKNDALICKWLTSKVSGYTAERRRHEINFCFNIGDNNFLTEMNNFLFRLLNVNDDFEQIFYIFLLKLSIRRVGHIHLLINNNRTRYFTKYFCSEHNYCFERAYFEQIISNSFRKSVFKLLRIKCVLLFIPKSIIFTNYLQK